MCRCRCDRTAVDLSPKPAGEDRDIAARENVTAHAEFANLFCRAKPFAQFRPCSWSYSIETTFLPSGPPFGRTRPVASFPDYFFLAFWFPNSLKSGGRWIVA